MHAVDVAENNSLRQRDAANNGRIVVAARFATRRYLSQRVALHRGCASSVSVSLREV